MCQPAVVLSSTSFDDIPPMVSAAPPAAALNDHRRRRATQRLADFILEVVNRPASKPPRAKPLPVAYAMGIVGAINELVLQAIEQDRVRELAELSETASQLARAVIDGVA